MAKVRLLLYSFLKAQCSQTWAKWPGDILREVGDKSDS